MNRDDMIRRLLYLRNWECANVFLLPACMYFLLTSFKVQDWRPYLLSVLILCLILAQGAFYWHLKLQVVYRNKPALPAYFHYTFSMFKRVNVVLLFTYALLSICSQITSLINFPTSIWSNALFLFVVLEYVNYYHYQLSHDNWNDIRFLMKYQKIRRSPLWSDLQRTARSLKANYRLMCSDNGGNVGKKQKLTKSHSFSQGVSR